MYSTINSTTRRFYSVAFSSVITNKEFFPTRTQSLDTKMMIFVLTISKEKPTRPTSSCSLCNYSFVAVLFWQSFIYHEASSASSCEEERPFYFLIGFFFYLVAAISIASSTVHSRRLVAGTVWFGLSLVDYFVWSPQLITRSVQSRRLPQPVASI